MGVIPGFKIGTGLIYQFISTTETRRNKPTTTKRCTRDAGGNSRTVQTSFCLSMLLLRYSEDGIGWVSYDYAHDTCGFRIFCRATLFSCFPRHNANLDKASSSPLIHVQQPTDGPD